MQLVEEDLSEKIDIALRKLRKERGEALASAITPIIELNRSRNRVRLFIGNGTVQTVDEYVLRVADYYEQLHEYVRAIQVERSDREWRPLIKKMAQMAYGYFRRRNLPSSSTTWEKAEICAQEGAKRLLSAHFPYDTAFLPWLSVLIRFTSAKLIQEDHKTENLDLTRLGEVLRDPHSETGRSIENRLAQAKAIVDAIEKLTHSRKAVILMHYFEGKSFAEIAAALDKSINAVHQLHFHALNSVRELLLE